MRGGMKEAEEGKQKNCGEKEEVASIKKKRAIRSGGILTQGDGTIK